MPGKIFFPNFFLGINFFFGFAPPPHHFSNGPSLILGYQITHNTSLLLSTVSGGGGGGVNHPYSILALSWIAKDV